MRYIQGIGALIFFLSLITGCGFKDLDKRFFVTAIGVDKTNNTDHPWKVTLKLVIPSPKIEPGKENFQIVQEESDTITGAIRLMKSKVDKEFDFGHTKIIVLGESLVGKDIPDAIDWFVRRRDIQEISYVMVGKPSAEKILEIKPKSERVPSNALILSYGGVGTESSYIVTEYLFDFYRRLKERGVDPFLPIVKELDAQTYQIDTVALCDKKKVKLVLTPEETRLLNQFIFKIPKFDVPVKTDKDKFVMSVEDFKSKYIIETPMGKKPYIDISLSYTGILEESKYTISNERWKQYEMAIAEVAQKRYMAVLQKIQKANLDPIGFGLHYMATSAQGKQAWDDWRTIYPNIEFHVKVKVGLKGSGKIN